MRWLGHLVGTEDLWIPERFEPERSVREVDLERMDRVDSNRRPKSVDSSSDARQEKIALSFTTTPLG